MAIANYPELTAHLPFDIRAEALAAELLESDANLSGSEQIMIRPLGHLNRIGGREVQHVSGSHFNATGKELVYVDISREGLFDALPEMLFTRPDAVYEDEVEKAQDLEQQRAKSRQFFLPFEEEFYRTRIGVEVAERHAVRRIADWLLAVFGLNGAGDGTGSGQQRQSTTQAISFALVLPFINRIVGDFGLTSSLLATVLKKRVTITTAVSQPIAIPEAQQSGLGEALLGINFTVGSSFLDGIRTLQVAIGEVSPEEVENWLPGGSLRSLVEEQLFAYLLPAGEQVELLIQVSASDEGLVLGDHPATSVLGYTTQIS